MALVDYWNYKSGKLIAEDFKYMDEKGITRPVSYHYKHKKNMIKHILHDFRRFEDPLEGAMWLTTVMVVRLSYNPYTKGIKVKEITPLDLSETAPGNKPEVTDD